MHWYIDLLIDSSSESSDFWYAVGPELFGINTQTVGSLDQLLVLYEFCGLIHTAHVNARLKDATHV